MSADFWSPVKLSIEIALVSGILASISGLFIGKLMANKKFIPAAAGTLKTDSLTFGVMTFAVIIIINALSYFPALALGPIAEYFSMH